MPCLRWRLLAAATSPDRMANAATRIVDAAPRSGKIVWLQLAQCKERVLVDNAEAGELRAK
jgi:hypothetical protein